VSLHSSSSSGLTRTKAQTFLEMQELHSGKKQKNTFIHAPQLQTDSFSRACIAA
jgi:hypothetical protein